MDIKEQLTAFVDALFHLIDVKGIEMLGLKVLAAAGILLAAFLISRGLQQALIRRFAALGEGNEERLRVYRKIVRIVVNMTGFGLALHALGINMTHMFAGGGLLAVAMAFAMKNLAENLMSGLIMGLERSIKTGDVLQLEGVMVQVKSIGIRATIVRTKSEQDMLIPNAKLVQSVVTNYNYRDSLVRITAEVGVAYDADLDKVFSTLKGVCERFDWTSPQKPSHGETDWF